MSITTTSSFPLPYKPPSASHLTSSEPPWTAVSLTSQDIKSYQPTSLQSDRGRALYGSGGDSWAVSASFRDAGLPESTLNAGHFSPQDQLNWQYSRAGPPQDRILRGPGYGTRRAPLNPHHSPRSDPSSRSSMELSFSPENQNQPLFDIHPSRKHGFSSSETELQRPSQPLLSSPLDDHGPMDFSGPSNNVPMCGSRYPSTLDGNDSIRSIRETPHWPEMKDDPIFCDLSKEGPTISIDQLITRRKLALKDHVLQPVMNEKGTQTDFEAHSPAISTRSSDRDIGLNQNHSATLKTASQTTQAVEATFTHTTSRSSSRTANSFPRRRLNGTANRTRLGRNHFSETPTSQPRHNSMRSLKRLRTVTEDYKDIVDTQEAKLNNNLRQRDNSVYGYGFFIQI